MSNGSKVARNGSTSKTGGLGKRVITCTAGLIKEIEVTFACRYSNVQDFPEKFPDFFYSVCV